MEAMLTSMRKGGQLADLLHDLHVGLWPDAGDILELLWFCIFSPTISCEDSEGSDKNGIKVDVCAVTGRKVEVMYVFRDKKRGMHKKKQTVIR